MAHDDGINIINLDWKRLPVARLFGPPALYQAAFQHNGMLSRS
jgi:hypothetical protein